MLQKKEHNTKDYIRFLIFSELMENHNVKTIKKGKIIKALSLVGVFAKIANYIFAET